MANEGRSDSFGKAHKSLNVFNKPLGQFAKGTGFYRNGLCDVGPDDTGNHSVAATLTDSFLDFSASRGNKLRDAGLTGGKKWCLDAISLEDLKKYAAEPEAANASTVPQSRKGNNLPGGVPTKERTELAGTDEMTGSRQRGNY
ncbi:hypothetical protein BOTNAR_0547g00010 [Botryotinia narcissicola]|uniref:Uncharacterized protein n=1 Tax=Botryotinia narcissicola TaxID=278944 RepID=A0A4Z1HJX3_9HELO|nr:hypothetical protein BOTNAR_0547g00010 [Botryotinia narcissicola]